jgi:dTDP-4-dehydrorhamnose 3,5-epimerase
MILVETAIPGAFLIRPEAHRDGRGAFARTWCEREAAAHGLNPHVAQSNISYTARMGTLRGLHYQVPPWAEAKLVRCTRGAIHDVIVDLRPNSSMYLQHTAVVLTAESWEALYIPEGFAHGFQTLADGTEVVYQMSQAYAPDFERGIRWNDPQFGIRWPLPVHGLSARDQAFPDFETLPRVAG